MFQEAKVILEMGDIVHYSDKLLGPLRHGTDFGALLDKDESMPLITQIMAKLRGSLSPEFLRTFDSLQGESPILFDALVSDPRWPIPPYLSWNEHIEHNYTKIAYLLGAHAIRKVLFPLIYHTHFAPLNRFNAPYE